MKNIFILIVVSSFFCVPAFSQKTAPDAVKKEFAKKYPAAQSVKWDSEEANEWEAEFKNDGKEMSAAFDNKGAWLETETGISSKELPAAVTTTLTKEFAGYKTGEISIIETPVMKGFELALKKAETSVEVVFDNTGKVIKKTNTGEEKEDKN
jgi:hypothetical protein